MFWGCTRRQSAKSKFRNSRSPRTSAARHQLCHEDCACRALLSIQAYAPLNQPLTAPRAARWFARRREAGVPGVSAVDWADLPEEGAARSAVRQLKLEPLRGDAWERRKHVVVCRALIKARRKAMMDRAEGKMTDRAIGLMVASTRLGTFSGL